MFISNNFFFSNSTIIDTVRLCYNMIISFSFYRRNFGSNFTKELIYCILYSIFLCMLLCLRGFTFFPIILLRCLKFFITYCVLNWICALYFFFICKFCTSIFANHLTQAPLCVSSWGPSDFGGWSIGKNIEWICCTGWSKCITRRSWNWLFFDGRRFC